MNKVGEMTVEEYAQWRRELSTRNLITTRIIALEFERTHPGKACYLSAEDFSTNLLRLSLDEFSRRLGWMG